MTKNIEFEGVERNINGRFRSHLDLSRVPIEISKAIYELVELPEYQHDNGNPNYTKIANKLNINHITVHMYLDDNFRHTIYESVQEYANSEKGISTKEKYRNSNRYKEIRRLYFETDRGKEFKRKQLEKRKLEEFREWEREYIKRPHIKAKRKEYQQSEHGKNIAKKSRKKRNILNYDSCNEGFKALANMIRLSYGIKIDLKEQNSAINSFINSTSLTPNQIKYDLPRAPFSYINFFNETFDAQIDYDAGMTSEEKLEQKKHVWSFVKNSSFMPGEIKLNKLVLMKNKYINFFNKSFDAEIDEELSKQESEESNKIRKVHLVKVKQHYINNYKKCNTGFKSLGNLNDLFSDYQSRELVTD